MKYFAYGSNMLESRLKHVSRAPSARCLGVTALRGYTIRFHKRSKDGSGKCNVWPTGYPQDAVYGVVYDIAPEDVPALDRVEGLADHEYHRDQVDVELGEPGRIMRVECYHANPKYIDETLVPYDWYKALVVAGALEHHLPNPYVEILRIFPCIEDKDRIRRGEALELLGPFRGEFDSGRLTGRTG